MKNLFNGLKSLMLRPKLVKIIFLVVIIVFMYNIYNYLKTEKNPVYFFSFYLAIPAYLYILGMINQEKEEKMSVKENSLPAVQKDNIPVDEFNDQQDIDKLEKRIIKTSRTEEIETIYFRGGQAYRNKETYYFNREGN
jgi:amino acid permease